MFDRDKKMTRGEIGLVQVSSLLHSNTPRSWTPVVGTSQPAFVESTRRIRIPCSTLLQWSSVFPNMENATRTWARASSSRIHPSPPEQPKPPTGRSNVISPRGILVQRSAGSIHSPQYRHHLCSPISPQSASAATRIEGCPESQFLPRGPLKEAPGATFKSHEELYAWCR